ncbi:MAG: cytidine deaminase [Chloroflexi bacterium]|nr:cytidine deaminase [Chloroflexota bacterium]
MDEKLLLAAAFAARKRAYAPYSNYHVGAALLTEEGKVFQGCNIENAAYSVSLCAERVAIFKAASEGHRRFRALAVVTENGGAPCGPCRQVMREFAPDLVILIADVEGRVRRTTLAELFPDAFGPDQLA